MLDMKLCWKPESNTFCPLTYFMFLRLLLVFELYSHELYHWKED